MDPEELNAYLAEMTDRPVDFTRYLSDIFGYRNAAYLVGNPGFREEYLPDIVEFFQDEEEFPAYSAQKILAELRVARQTFSLEEMATLAGMTGDVGGEEIAEGFQTGASVATEGKDWEQIKALRALAREQGVDPLLVRYSSEYGGNYAPAYLQDILSSLAQPLPRYSPSTRGEIPGAQAYETYDAAGNIKSQRARSSKGQLGRSLTNDRQLAGDIKRVLVACLLENYDRLVTNQTGALRAAVAGGELSADPELIQFIYTLKDEPGRPRYQGSQRERPPTRTYGPWVFQGRPAIVSSKGPMVFHSQGSWKKRRIVAAAEPRNIFLLTEGQISRIDTVLVKGITDKVARWLAQWEGAST